MDLTVPAGEFFSLLGPSGCGKTTTLCMIVGFEQPSGGRVLLDGVAVRNGGHVERVRSPRQMYEEPATAFVAAFIGVSNLMDVRADGPSAGGVALELGSGIVVQARRGDVTARGAVKAVIRPERVR